MPKLRVHRKSYRRGGKRIKGSTYLTKDRGKRGRTPKSERWYETQVETEWHKELDKKTRRALALKGHKGDLLATARGLQALSNVTTDRETKAKARADAQYFFDEYRKRG